MPIDGTFMIHGNLKINVSTHLKEAQILGVNVTWPFCLYFGDCKGTEKKDFLLQDHIAYSFAPTIS